jgi:hypothetical protein
MILKAKLCTESELGYIAQLFQNELINAGVTTHTRLLQLTDHVFWLVDGDTCGCCGAKIDDTGHLPMRLTHWSDCPVVLARRALRPPVPKNK